MKIIRKNEQKTTLWLGGKTTELFIYPEDSSYAERNFQFRISTATVETEASEFTRLPGYKRHLMILEGTLNINHKHYHQKLLSQFETDEFMGDWETTGEGKVTDLNLMHDANWKGSLELIQLEKTQQHSINIDSSLTAFYVLNESVIIDDHELQKGDFAIAKKEEKITISTKGNAMIICIKINSSEL